MSQDKDNNEAASAPDLRPVLIEVQNALKLANEIRDGGPICDTIWMPERSETLFDFIESAIEAASASQSSTAGAAKRGETSDEFTDKLRRLVGSSHQNFDEILAHVARQESAADTGAASVDTPELRKLMRHYYDTASSFAGSSPADAALLAVFAHIETVYGAQQREAGRRERDDEVELLTQRATEAECEYAALALARQPVSEGLTQAIEPFAKIADQYSPQEDDSFSILADFPHGLVNPLTLGQCRAARAALSAVPPATQPVKMILHCPSCHLQHIDAPESQEVQMEGGVAEVALWANPPHRSHLCHGCGHIWRPADVPTEGVKAIQTRGSNDSAVPPAKQQPAIRVMSGRDAALQLTGKIFERPAFDIMNYEDEHVCALDFWADQVVTRARTLIAEADFADDSAVPPAKAEGPTNAPQIDLRAMYEELVAAKYAPKVARGLHLKNRDGSFQVSSIEQSYLDWRDGYRAALAQQAKGATK